MIIDEQNRSTERITSGQNNSADRIIREQRCATDRILKENESLIKRIENFVIQNLALPQAGARSTKRVTHTESSIDSNLELPEGQISGSSAVQVSRHQSTITGCYQFLIGTVYLRQTRISISASDDDEGSVNDTVTQTKNNWSFFPTFISRCVEIRFQNTYSSVFQGLKSYQVIDSEDPIFNICHNGSATDLKNYFDNNRHRLSQFVVEGSGRGLLFVGITQIAREALG